MAPGAVIIPIEASEQQNQAYSEPENADLQIILRHSVLLNDSINTNGEDEEFMYKNNKKFRTRDKMSDTYPTISKMAPITHNTYW